MATTYRADWVFTGDGEPLRDGILEVADGRIVAVSAWDRKKQVDIDLGQSLVTPGFVNAHTHLDLGALQGKLPAPKQFTDWLRQVVDYRRGNNTSEWDGAIRAGIAESLRHGTTCLSDISVGGRSAEPLGATALDAEVALELIGMSDERVVQAVQAAQEWMQRESDSLQLVLSPHAPYTVSYLLLASLAIETPWARLVMHVAETREELELLEQETGPFKEFLQSLGAWQPENLIGSIDELLDVLSGFEDVSLIHCNYLTRDQWQRLKEDTTVVYCPRTHAYFGHEPHPYLKMLADGVPVALGTDSLASNPDLSILNECRFLWRRDRAQLNGPTLLGLATNTSLSLQRRADFVVIPHGNEASDPWELLWGGSALPSAVYLRGEEAIPTR